MKLTNATQKADAYYDHERYLDRPKKWLGKLDSSLKNAKDALLALQHPEGYWVFELEADCTIPAEYILMMHYMDEVDNALQSKIALYLRTHQNAEGGWPLYHGGEFDLSCSVKAYYALKLAGDNPQALHMVKARKAILAHGGAARVNVFTRITLALFEQIPWRGVPFIPVEIMLLPRWFPFHLRKVSYWSRTVMVPLFILCSLRPKARNPSKTHIHEIFTIPAEEEKHYFSIRSPLNRLFLALDAFGRFLEPAIPRKLRERAIRKAEAWFVKRLNGSGGLGAIFPAMVNAYEALDVLGYAADHPYRISAKAALQKLLVEHERWAYCQPCVSPVWDTALACLSLQGLEDDRSSKAVIKGLAWLQDRQLLTEQGDWREYRPKLRGGGWPFQFRNDYYPDLDDTAAVAWAMDLCGDQRFEPSVIRAAEWLAGMQSNNGGFTSFDADNTYFYLNEIPFADHGALLDPPTADVSARCLTLFARLVDKHPQYREVMSSCLDYLRNEQEPEGYWFGRWGTNYIYGTWAVLQALREAGADNNDPAVRRAVEWLKGTQRSDGGWGETNDSYTDRSLAGKSDTSSSFSTAWALLALLSAEEADSPEVARGIEYLIRHQSPDGLWHEPDFSAPGFPRVFYLKYHGYSKYFPIWALARYRFERQTRASFG